MPVALGFDFVERIDDLAAVRPDHINELVETRQIALQRNDPDVFEGQHSGHHTRLAALIALHNGSADDPGNDRHVVAVERPQRALAAVEEEADRRGSRWRSDRARTKWLVLQPRDRWIAAGAAVFPVDTGWCDEDQLKMALVAHVVRVDAPALQFRLNL